MGWRSPRDGADVLAVTAMHPERDLDLATELVSVPTAGGDTAPTVLIGADAELSIGGTAVTPDGTIVFLASTLGSTRRDFVARDSALYLLENGNPRALTDAATLDISETDIRSLVVDDASFLVQIRTRGTNQLARVSRDSGAVEQLTHGPVEVNGAGEAGGNLWASIATPESLASSRWWSTASCAS